MNNIIYRYLQSLLTYPQSGPVPAAPAFTLAVSLVHRTNLGKVFGSARQAHARECHGEDRATKAPFVFYNELLFF